MSEFTPQDFADFQNDQDAMNRYRECADRCLLFNFRGAVAPLIQEIIEDATNDEADLSQHQCVDCPMSKREQELAILLLIDSLL